MNNNLIVAVDRQFASGGIEICNNLSKHFDIPLYGKSVIRDAIVKKGFKPDIFDNAEEIANNSLMYSLSMGIYSKTNGNQLDISGHSINQVQSDVVTELSQKGPCIFVGCCADYILNDYNGCIKIFIKAGMDFRIERARKLDMLGLNCGENDIRKQDRQRENYHNCFADGSFGCAENYHLIVDSSLVGVDKASVIIADYINAFLSEHPQISSKL